MKFFPMTEDELYDYLNRPFNPPDFTPKFTEEDFDEEWDDVCEQLEQIVGRFGESDDFGEKDYTMSEFNSNSRGIGVTVTSGKLLAPELLTRVQDWLVTLKNDYDIHFNFQNPRPAGNLFVSKKEIKGRCSGEIVNKLGLVEEVRE